MVLPFSLPGPDYKPEDLTLPQARVPIHRDKLWVASLCCSLLVAVLSMLIKQWLGDYHGDLPPQPRDRAQERQARYDGLQHWRIHALQQVTPILTYAAVILFSIGLPYYLLPQRALFIISMFFGSLLVTLYLGATVCGLCYPRCPYKTTFDGSSHI
jgi:hypothetical protein